MCKNKVIVVIGHSGSGKSTLTKMLGEYFSCEALGFSYAGKILAEEDANSIFLTKLTTTYISAFVYLRKRVR